MLPYLKFAQADINSCNDFLAISHQAIVWAHADLLSIEPIQTNIKRVLIALPATTLLAWTKGQ